MLPKRPSKNTSDIHLYILIVLGVGKGGSLSPSSMVSDYKSAVIVQIINMIMFRKATPI